MSEIESFSGKCDESSVSARRIWAHDTNPMHARHEEPVTYKPVSQCLAEYLELEEEIRGRLTEVQAKIADLRDV